MGRCVPSLVGGTGDQAIQCSPSVKRGGSPLAPHRVGSSSVPGFLGAQGPRAPVRKPKGPWPGAWGLTTGARGPEPRTDPQPEGTGPGTWDPRSDKPRARGPPSVWGPLGPGAGALARAPGPRARQGSGALVRREMQWKAHSSEGGNALSPLTHSKHQPGSQPVHSDVGVIFH